MKVLVADDDPTTRMLLEKRISAWGHTVSAVANGQEAWDALAEKDPPRIAILDWMMPGMDGVTICKRLWENNRKPMIYTLVLTSKKRTDDLIEALQNGAHDYQMKPISLNELRSRISVGMRLIEADDTVQRYAQDMEHLAEERAKQLVHADRLVTLGTLTAGIAHEITNPLSYVDGNVQILKKYWNLLTPYLPKADDLDHADPRIPRLAGELPALLDSLTEGTTRLREIVKGMQRFARKERDKKESCNLNSCVENALLLCHSRIKNTVRVQKNLDDTLPEIQLSTQSIEQVAVNLIANACDAMKGRRNAVLTVTTTKRADGVAFIVDDNGTGFTPEILKQIWNPFFTTKTEDAGTGLGLSISKGIVDDLGGTVHAKNNPEGGARFTVSLPVQTLPNESMAATPIATGASRF